MTKFKIKVPARQRGERGMAIMITSVVMLFLIPFVGLSVDAGLAFVVKSRLGAALDSAALAAGRSLNIGTDLTAAQASAVTSATRFFNANFPIGALGTSSSNRVIHADFTLQTDENGNPNGVLVVSVNGSVSAPAYFTRLLGNNSYTISSSGTATRKVLVMSLLLDQSASMGTRNTSVGTIPTTLASNASSCEAMVYSAIKFLDNFTPYDYIGVVAFDYTASEVYAPSTNFKGGQAAAHAIANLNCGNNTNTTAALELGYREVQRMGLKLARNEVVLFTDGVPNGVTANFPLRTQVDDRLGPVGVSTTPKPTNNPTGNTTACADDSGPTACHNMPACTTTVGTRYGVITQTSGFSVDSGSRVGPQKAFDSDSLPGIPTNCPQSGTAFTSQTIAYIPDVDAFGNSTHGPWDAWLYQTNNQCAPNGTPITSGNTLCKNMGDLWANHASTGTGRPSNSFQSGPYQGKFRTDTANSIGVTSMNSAVNEATKIRSDTNYKITIDTIYLQGNGSDPVDRAFLQIVSNQKVIEPLIYDHGDAVYDNPYFQVNQQQGMFKKTANATDLTSLFAQVASSLLRISQ